MHGLISFKSTNMPKKECHRCTDKDSQMSNIMLNIATDARIIFRLDQLICLKKNAKDAPIMPVQFKPINLNSE
jgi:hypothetical protein